MKRREMIDQEASRWLAARDAGPPSVEQEAEFHGWIEADIRHRVAYLRLEETWRRSDRLNELRPLDRDVDADLLRSRSARARWPLALAASFLGALVFAGYVLVQSQFGWQHYETAVGGFSRIVLEDGSVMDLNTDSDVKVRIDAQRREVRLLRGEGRFQVAHESTRPFVVSAADADVRAVGTAFTVRLHAAARVDVLVSEGSVAIASPGVLHSPPVKAGEVAVLLPDRLSVSRIEPQQVESRLAWTSGKLQFRGETLREAAAEFNRYNRRQIQLGDPALADLRVGGTFNATDPESFAAALTSTFSLRVEPGSPDTIVLRPP
jgi:transmembrane sensor